MARIIGKQKMQTNGLPVKNEGETMAECDGRRWDHVSGSTEDVSDGFAGTSAGSNPGTFETGKENININQNYLKPVKEGEERTRGFSSALLEIEDEQLRRFVEYVLEKAPDSFYTIPASVSGKYHAIDETRPGGLVRHVKRTFLICRDLLTRKECEIFQKDSVLAAVILHDIGKYAGYKDHEIVGHNFIMSRYNEFFSTRNASQELNRKIDIMLFLVATHMGEFGIDKCKIPFYANSQEKEFLDKMAYVVQTADYIASRRYIDIRV